MPYSTPGDASTVTLHWLGKWDVDYSYYRNGWSNSWIDDGCFGADCYGMFADPAGNKDVTVTVPAGYTASYLVSGAEYGSGWGTGSSASFYCGNSVRIDWYYTPICNANSWSAWSACSATCGGGTQYRVNACGTTQTQSCNTQACIISPWWQVKDSDVQTIGDLVSRVPALALVPFFGDVGGGTYPGVPAYGGSTNLTSANISATGWAVIQLSI